MAPSRTSFAALLAMAVFLCPIPSAAQGPDAVARAKALVEAKQPAAAYELLAPLEGTRAGDVSFDYWLGAAALDSGHLDRALAAFERVLAKAPDFHVARLDMGRTYLRMGSLDLAAQEFRELQARAPDPSTRALLQRYLDEIARLKARQRFAAGGYVEVGAGRDTNLSSTTRDFPGAVLGSFGLPGVEPTGNAVRRADDYTAAAAGGDIAWRVAEDRVAFAVANVRWRGYREFDEFDSLLGDMIVGYQDRRGEIQWTATGFAQAFREDGAAIEALDGGRIRYDSNAAGVGVELRKPVAARWQLALGAQVAAIRYPSNPGQDVRNVTLSAAAEWRPDAWSEGAMVGKVFYGQDEARRPLNDFTATTASRHSHGVRVAAFSDARGRVSWQGALGWTRRIDDDPYARATLVATGRDDLFEGYLQASWKVADGWVLQPYASYTYNRSNIPVYGFRKADGGLVLRREFR